MPPIAPKLLAKRAGLKAPMSKSKAVKAKKAKKGSDNVTRAAEKIKEAKSAAPAKGKQKAKVANKGPKKAKANPGGWKAVHLGRRRGGGFQRRKAEGVFREIHSRRVEVKSWDIICLLQELSGGSILLLQ